MSTKQAHKPIVRYKPHLLNIINIGRPARIIPVDHPSAKVSNTTFVLTSPVRYIADNGDFGTDNTLYVIQENL